MNKTVQPQWLEWAKELQFIAQGGLTYSKDVFDIERFERIREIAAEMLSLQSEIPIEKVKNLFCNETGFQTPKLDTRAAIFKDDKILLVKEKNGTWSLPGGWVDINQSIKTNTEKEVKEEAGFEYVETLEETLTYSISIDKLNDLYKSRIDIANWMRVLQQENFLLLQDIHISRLNLSAQERYEKLIKEYPSIFHRVTLGHIASFLGITQPSLSRIRSSR